LSDKRIADQHTLYMASNKADGNISHKTTPLFNAAKASVSWCITAAEPACQLPAVYARTVNGV
jgi:hypothetical protein